MTDKTTLTPFVEIGSVVGEGAKAFAESPGYYLVWGLLLLALFCGLVLTGGDDG